MSELGLEVWVRKKPDELIDRLLGEMAFAQTICLVDEQDFPEGFLEQFLGFRASLSDVLGNHVRGRTLDNLRGS